MTTPAYQPKIDWTDWQPATGSEYERILSVIAPQLHPYVAEHAQLGALMDQVREGYQPAIYEKALAAIGEELEHHFHYEETCILPRLANHIPATDVGPIKKLKQEHQVIRKNHQEAVQLFAARSTEDPDKDLLQKMNMLAYLLKKHIEKEDHYFFPMVSLILTEEEKDQIADELQQLHAG